MTYREEIMQKSEKEGSVLRAFITAIVCSTQQITSYEEFEEAMFDATEWNGCILVATPENEQLYVAQVANISTESPQKGFARSIRGTDTFEINLCNAFDPQYPLRKDIVLSINSEEDFQREFTEKNNSVYVVPKKVPTSIGDQTSLPLQVFQKVIVGLQKIVNPQT